MLLTFPGRSIGTAGVSVGSGSSVGIGVSVGSGSTVGIGVSTGSEDGSLVAAGVSVGSADGSLVAVGVSFGSADGSSVSADALTNAFVDTVHCEFLLTAACPVTRHGNEGPVPHVHHLQAPDGETAVQIGGGFRQDRAGGMDRVDAYIHLGGQDL